MIAPEGIPFLLGAAALAAVLSLLWPRTIPAALFGALLTVFVGWFFRNPDRTPPSLPGAVISPADGKIMYAGDNPPGRYLDEPGKRVSVFMSVFDVHVNRAPVSGKVVSVRYHPGKFLAANVEKASLANEQNGVLLETPDGQRVAYVQIAGLIARRIVCDLAEGDTVRQGQRVGIIRFGSRVDILLPAFASLSVRAGDRVRAGESVVGVLP
ncbi:MAG TPA: phosphatidylserine decarboxylase family protein [Candidatus Deferrimicrobiaceae bacterium]|nr:phosphatidylserine decarboxylase family protein [Candidatus Deferrimicrobiaceae bacterium]